MRKPAPKKLPPLSSATDLARESKRTGNVNTLPLPELVPCFQVDGFGCARPYDPLTRAEAQRALNILLADCPLETRAAAWKALAKSKETSVRPTEWAKALSAVYGSTAADKEAETISRLDAANMIADHYTLDPITDDDSFYLDMAITEETLGFATLLEPGTLQKEEVASQIIDGFYWIRGYLFKMDDQGHSVPNAEDGVLTFDASGRYTSGDEELDKLVANTLQQIIGYEEDRLAMLRAAYLYSRDSNRYVGYHNHDFSYQVADGEDGWSLELAKSMLTEHKGNCYYFASEFTYLARGLGYQMHTLGGFINGYTAHGWCELVEDNQVYIFDPELEWNRHSQGEWSRDFYHKTYDELNIWKYESSVPRS